MVYDVDDFYAGLVDHKLIYPTGVAGAYGRGEVFEDVLRCFDALVTRTAAPDGAQEMNFPPILPRALIEKLGYLDNFPQLAGSVHSFAGNDSQARELSGRLHDGQRWEDLLEPTAVMLAPAACYPVYPNFSGLLPEGGRLVTVLGATSPRPSPPACSLFACASTSAWARRRWCCNGATTGWRARSLSCRAWVSRPKAMWPAILFLAVSAR
jgi:hypothetical protein